MRRRAVVPVLVFIFLVSGCATSKMDGTRSPAGYTDGVQIIVKNGDTASFTPPANPGNPISDDTQYDVVVMGGGLAGLTASLFLTDSKKKVLLLEKEGSVGGLASFSEEGGTRYGRGAAYWTDPYREETAILNRIGLANYEQRYPIPEPIDSFYVRGQYYKGIWDPETLEKLPASFSVFKFELQRMIDANVIPDQPIEEAPKYGKSLALDKLTSRQWIESMPGTLEKFLNGDNSAKNYDEGKRIYDRYQRELGADPKGMQGVIELLDLYNRSALGGTTDNVSAVALANFYESEIITRYTSNEGTGVAAQKMITELQTKPDLFTFKVKAAVTKMSNKPDGVDVFYNFDGQSHRVHARYAIFASQLKIAPKVIEDFKEKAPLQVRTIQSLDYTHYSTHNVHVEGQPYRSAYDTWVHANDYTDDDFSDVILGEWMDPRMAGYQGYRDFKKDPPVADGVFTIYHPLPIKWMNSDYSQGDAEQIARRATERLGDLLTKLPPDLWQGPFKVKYIETNRWPLAIHTVRPGFFTKMVKILRRPFGHIYFAHSNLGTPAFEEAIFRGHCAADNILKKMDAKFVPEQWTRCPFEK